METTELTAHWKTTAPEDNHKSVLEFERFVFLLSGQKSLNVWSDDTPKA